LASLVGIIKIPLAHNHHKIILVVAILRNEWSDNKHTCLMEIVMMITLSTGYYSDSGDCE